MEVFVVPVVVQVAVAFDVEVDIVDDVDADGFYGAEVFGCADSGDHGGFFLGLGGEHEEADEGVAEEEGEADDDHDEEDVDFVAEDVAREGEGQVCGC